MWDITFQTEAQQRGEIIHHPIPLPMSDTLQSIIRNLAGAGMRALVVGGAVRDALTGIQANDIDIEVYNCNYDDLAKILSRSGRIDIVGRSFGVIKFDDTQGNNYDFSIPRRDNKAGGVGHQNFISTFDPTMTPREACSRRDFTWNAMGYDPITEEVHDYFGGRSDLQTGIIRHTGPTFAEDPLRVLRGMQFAARFGHRLADETADLSRILAAEIIERWIPIPPARLAAIWADRSYADGPKGIVPRTEDGALRPLAPYEALTWELPRERLAEEWMKLVTKGKQPSVMFEYLRASGWDEFFPEICDLRGVPQEPLWHPEGDVALHTGYVMDAAKQIADRDGLEGDARAVLLFAALTHDFAKPQTTERTQKTDPATGEIVWRWTSNGHETAGGPVAEAFLTRIGIKPEIIRKVVPLVENHLRHLDFGTGRSPHPRVIRRLAERLRDPRRKHHASIEELARLIEADHSGRPRPGEPIQLHQSEAVMKMIRMAEENEVAEKPIHDLILGRHLMRYGLAPSPVYTGILRAAHEAQLDGIFTAETAEAWLDDYMVTHHGLTR